MADANQSFSEPPPPYSAAVPDARGKTYTSAPYPQPPPPGFNVPPASNYAAPAPGYAPGPAQGYAPAPGLAGYAQTGAYPAPSSTTIVATTQPQQTVTVIRMGNCPRCQTGVMVEDFTCCGILLALLFFPLGLICCLLLKDHHCNNCGYSP